RESMQSAPTQGGFRMVNKSLLMGVALGVGFATAGGVTAYQFLGGVDRQDGTVMIEQDALDQDAHAEHGSIQHDTHDSGATAAPASAVAQPAPRPAAPAAAPAPAPASAAVREECYEEA